MTNHLNSEDQDRLIDYLRGELPPEEQAGIRVQLAQDREFKRLHDDLANTFAAMEVTLEYTPPKNLAKTTLERIRHARQTDALLAKEERRRFPRGPVFSLRELGAVAAAVLLMAVAFIPAMRYSRQQAVVAQCASNVGQIGSALLTYATANNDFLPSVNSAQTRWLGGQKGQPAFSNSEALYKLIHDGYSSPVIFLCPASQRESFVAQAGMNDFPAGKYVGYSYQHSARPEGLRIHQPSFASQSREMVLLADSTPMFSGGAFRTDQLRHQTSENHDRSGQNVLYLDGHVQWTQKAEVGVNNDHIFQVAGVRDYRGDEAPANETDTFLLPAFSGTTLAKQP